MLCKLSLKNIKKSFKDYIIYFATLILGVAIFYMFNAIDSQTAFMQVSEADVKAVQGLVDLIGAVSVVVAVILGYLVVYANRFLMKRRNKEFAVYMTLGMSKNKISLLLFGETVLLGVISLVIGILVGSGLSQLMSIFLINMFEADMREFKFIFSQDAMKQTIIYFGIIYLVVMLFNVGIVAKCKLIDLINSSKKNAKIKNKNLIIASIAFIISIVSLVYAYNIILDDNIAWDKIGLAVLLGCVGTLLFFWGLSGFLLKIIMSLKGVYFKSLNTFTTRQISSKINAEVSSLSTTCIMLFLTICILFASISVKNTVNEDLKAVTKVDYELVKEHIELDRDPNTINTALAQLENAGVTTQYLKDINSLSEYYVQGITYEGVIEARWLDTFKLWLPEGQEKVMKLSDYNTLARVFDYKEETLLDNEYIYVMDCEVFTEIRNEQLKKGAGYTVGEHILTPKYSKVVKGNPEMSTGHVEFGFVVVPDYIVDTYKTAMIKSYAYGDYNATNDVDREKIEKSVKGTMIYTDLMYAVTKIELKAAVVSISLLMVFIGLYIGVTILIASVAILSLKALTDSNDNKQRYNVLRQIGADEKMINGSILKQIAINFVLPLALAAVHSYVGIKFSKKILNVFAISGDNTTWIIVAVLILVIYGGYFLITYTSSKNIVHEN